MIAPRPTAPPASQSPHALARQFIDTHIAPAYNGQFARWTTAVCPITEGLTPAYNDFVSARIRSVAVQVGAPPTPSNRPCQTNVEVVFTPDPQQFVDVVAKHRIEMLGFHYRANVKSLTTVTRSVQAWYVTATRGGNPEAGLSMGDREVMDSPQMTMPGGCLGSHFTHCLSSLFYNALIVVDSKAVAGREIGPISDYLAMLALSQVKSLDACPQLPSILDLLSAGCGERPKPRTITPSDVAYLKALYKANLTLEVWLEKSDIGDSMVRQTAPQQPAK